MGIYLFTSPVLGSGMRIMHESCAVVTLVFVENDVQKFVDGKNRTLAKDAREIGNGNIGQKAAETPWRTSGVHITRHDGAHAELRAFEAK